MVIFLVGIHALQGFCSWVAKQQSCNHKGLKMQRHVTCPCQPGVPTQLNSWAKEEGYERFTFCQHCKKTRTYHWAPFLTKRMGCSLKTIEGWVRKTQINGRATGSYKMMPYLGLRVQACKQNLYSEKKNIYLHIPPYKMCVLQRAGWCTQPYHSVWSFFCLHPFILYVFCKTPRFIATVQ